MSHRSPVLLLRMPHINNCRKKLKTFSSIYCFFPNHYSAPRIELKKIQRASKFRKQNAT